MPEKLVDDSVLDLYKEGMANMRETFGRRILVKLPPVSQVCPNCMWDDVNKCSSGVYRPIYPYPVGIPGPKLFKGRCPICKGVGTVAISEQVKRVKALCYWLQGEEKEVTIGGKTYYVDIEVSNIDIRYYSLFEKAATFVVDEQELEMVSKPVKEGLRDLIKFTAYFKFGKSTNA